MSDQDAQDGKASTAPKRTSRWIKVALIASLALNVLFIGTVAGAFWRGGPGPWAGRGAGNIVGFIASLPPERRAELMQRSKALREQSRALRQAARQTTRDRVAALLAEPFDKQRFIDAQTRQIEADGKLRLMLRDIIAEAASGMSVAERRAFLNWRDRRVGPQGSAERDIPDDSPPPAKR
jgi:uncharacterized membrane protein